MLSGRAGISYKPIERSFHMNDMYMPSPCLPWERHCARRMGTTFSSPVARGVSR